MPEALSRETIIFTLRRMGYEVVASGGDNVLLVDPAYPARLLGLIFSSGTIEWDDLRRLLEYEGVSVPRFLSELESAG